MEYQYLFVDYETYSLLRLGNKKESKKSKNYRPDDPAGMDNYVKHPSTGISCLAYAFDHEDIKQWCPHLGPPPQELIDGMRNPKIIKIAWHAPFDYNITKHILCRRYNVVPWESPIEQWRDPIVLAHNLSLPGKLESVAKILKMAELKDARGEELKLMFCKPVSFGGEQTLFGVTQPLFRTWQSHPREFAEYLEYNKQDIRAMRDLWYRMLKIPFPDRDWQGWLLDQKINEFGMPGNLERAKKAYRIADRFVSEQKALLKQMTGLANPKSDDQMKGWLAPRGYSWGSLNAKYVTLELNNPDSKLTKEARDVLLIRIDARKTSYMKLKTFMTTLSSDGRLKYQFRYMGAPRTGRWAGGSEEEKSFQAQNMSRGEKAVKKLLNRALELVDSEDYDGILREFTNVPDKKNSVTPVSLVITLLRSMFEARPGKKLIVADLSAIEIRILGWMAGCWKMLETFTKAPEDGGDTYLDFGTYLYGKSYAEMWHTYKVLKDETERQNSKPPKLGCGYGLSGGEMYENENGDMVWGGVMGYARNVCGVEMPKELAHKAVAVYRNLYPEVVQLWTDLEEGFKQVLYHGGIVKVGEVTWDKQQRQWVKHPTTLGCVLTFTRHKLENDGWMIRMELPSGRALHYLNATVEEETKTSRKTGRPFTVNTIYYDGIEHSATQDAAGKTVKKRHKWGRVKTSGMKLTENADQAISRDIFLNGAIEADAMGFSIWGLFHDELACEEDDDVFGLTVDDLTYCMTQVPVWANGLLLGAEGWQGQVYRK